MFPRANLKTFYYPDFNKKFKLTTASLNFSKNKEQRGDYFKIVNLAPFKGKRKYTHFVAAGEITTKQ